MLFAHGPYLSSTWFCRLKSTIAGGFNSGSIKRSKAAASTACCFLESPGESNGYPWRNGTHNDRGGLTFSVTNRSKLMTTVEIPRLSSSAATRPTVWLHTGQTGMRSATSTPSDTSLGTTKGMVFFIKRPGAVIDPIIDKCR